MLTVMVLSRRQMEMGSADGADAVISIRPSRPVPREALDLACRQAVLGEVDAVLVQRFDDIGVTELGKQRGPTDTQLTEALDFTRDLRARVPGGRLAIHCEHGRSRSAALALAVIADGMGPGRETEAVARLMRLDVDNLLQPNPLLVRLADGALWRYGALEAALAASCPRYVAWRDHWRRVAADPAGARKGRGGRRRSSYDQDMDEGWTFACHEGLR